MRSDDLPIIYGPDGMGIMLPDPGAALQRFKESSRDNLEAAQRYMEARYGPSFPLSWAERDYMRRTPRQGVKYDETWLHGQPVIEDNHQEIDDAQADWETRHPEL